MGPTNHTPADQRLRERYGAGGGKRRMVLAAVVGTVAVTFLAWVVWAAWLHSTPQVDSVLIRWDAVDDHTVTAQVDVQLNRGVSAQCLLRALASDHTYVGDKSWVPTQGTNTVEIRTERRADAVELVGCTTPQQQRPR